MTQDKPPCPSCKGTGKSKSTLTMMEMRCFPCGGTGVTPYAGVGEIMQQAAPQAAGAVSIDSPEFHMLAMNFRDARTPEAVKENWAALTTHINAHAAQSYEEGFQDGRKHAHQQALTVTHALMAERDAANAGFKNFHRSLCVRFGCSHDERDWKRDQVSLEEYIASEMAIERKRADTAEASLARLVEGVEAATIWSHSPTMGVMVSNSPSQVNRKQFVLRDDLLALLPAKAECQHIRKATSAIGAMTNTGWHCTDCGKEFGDTPAPAMGEELPPLPNGLTHIEVWTPDQRKKGQFENSTCEAIDVCFNADHMHAYGRACMALRQPGAEVDDLAALIRQLVHSLKKSSPDNALAARAVDYLQRKGLQGSPLRAAPVSQPAAQEAAFKEVGSFLYEGFAYVATSGDDPRGIKLYRPLSDHPDHKAAPAPLSDPAGSEGLGQDGDVCHSPVCDDRCRFPNCMGPAPAPAGSEQEKKAARYDWLRHGDNDELVIQKGPVDPDYHWLPRNEKLDAMIDGHMAKQEQSK